MNNNQHELNEAQYHGECVRPAAGRRLSEYLTGRLEGAAAKEVEDHLLECLHCREFFLQVSRVRSRARAEREAHVGGNGSASNEAKVRRLADFRRGWT